MRLPSGAGAELARNGILERADAENHKRNRDIEVGAAKLWLTASGGTRWALEVDTYGALTAGGALPVAYGQLEADYTLTSTTNVQKAFDWSSNGALTLATGRYAFECGLFLTGMSATSGNAAFSLAGTATIAPVQMHVIGADNADVNIPTGLAGLVVDSTATPASMVTAGAGTELRALISGTFAVTAAGTIIPSIALVTAAAAVVEAGSYFRCERMGAASIQGSWA